MHFFVEFFQTIVYQFWVLTNCLEICVNSLFLRDEVKLWNTARDTKYEVVNHSLDLNLLKHAESVWEQRVNKFKPGVQIIIGDILTADIFYPLLIVKQLLNFIQQEDDAQSSDKTNALGLLFRSKEATGEKAEANIKQELLRDS